MKGNIEIKEQIDQLYYEISEAELEKWNAILEMKMLYKEIINLKKSIGEDYSYDEQLLNKL